MIPFRYDFTRKPTTKKRAATLWIIYFASLCFILGFFVFWQVGMITMAMHADEITDLTIGDVICVEGSEVADINAALFLAALLGMMLGRAPFFIGFIAAICCYEVVNQKKNYEEAVI